MEANSQTVSNSPILIPATNDENATERKSSTGPLVRLESRTGTVPCVATRLTATSTHWPPLPLYEDVNQRGCSVLTGCPFATF